MTTISDVHQITPEQKLRFDKYLETHCTSRCYNDMDCLHEGDFFEILADEMKSND